MRVSRRSLRKGLLAVGFLLGTPTLAGTVAGGLAIGLGGGLHLWAKGCLEPNQRLVTAGPYRFTRNPFYLGNALIDAGLCLVIGRPGIALGFAVLWGLAYRDTIAAEEAKLERLFPDAYPRYRAAVPRLFPTGRAWPAAETTGRFSWGAAGLARGQEYARLVGIALGPAVVWAGAALRREGLDVFAPERACLLAGLLAIPVVWVWKLALASAFRRPEVPLLPGAPGARARALAGIGLAAVAMGFAPGRPVLALLPALWAGLCGLDGFRAARVPALAAADTAADPATETLAGSARWRPLRWVSLASAVALVLLGVVHR